MVQYFTKEQRLKQREESSAEKLIYQNFASSSPSLTENEVH